MSGLRKLAADAGLPVIVEGLGTVFQMWFSEHPIRNWRDAERYADEALFTRWWQEMLLRGVLFHPEPVREPVRVPGAHRATTWTLMLDAAEQAFAVISRPTRLGFWIAMVLDLGGSRPDRPAPRAGRPASAGAGLLYEQVVDYVEQLVSERGLVPGDLLPTYAELAERVGVSLITVRRALDELERAGKVRRHQGLGTFLARPTDPDRADQGRQPARPRWPRATRPPAAESLDTRILDIRRGLPSADIARALQIRADSQVWQLRRQRMIDGQPAVVETSVIPVARARARPAGPRAGGLALRPARPRVRAGGRVRGAVPRGDHADPGGAQAAQPSAPGPRWSGSAG